jgi:hypothetical protein
MMVGLSPTELQLGVVGAGRFSRVVHLPAVGQGARWRPPGDRQGGDRRGREGRARAGDTLLASDRGPHYALAKGATPTTLMAKLYSRVTGASEGRGGYIHPARVGVGFIDGNSIAGATVGISSGDDSSVSTGASGGAA